MPPIILVLGGVALVGYLLSLGSRSASASSRPPSQPLPPDPLERPIIVATPPTPGVAPDVKKAIDKALARKPAATKPAPKPEYDADNPPPRLDKPAPRQDAAASSTLAYTEKRELPMTGPSVTTSSPSKVPDAVVPSEGTPPINLLNHDILPRPSGKALKLSSITTSPSAYTYALNAFHAIVDFADKMPSAPSEVASFAAQKYMDAASLAKQGGQLSKALAALRAGNALSDKAIKERKGA
ncbi:MAG: hypothetical protein WC763_07195 [Candidatus Paceibacterota bacterium]|jgi:hypothetical protein